MNNNQPYSIYIRNYGWVNNLNKQQLTTIFMDKRFVLEGFMAKGSRRYRVRMNNGTWGFWTEPDDIAGTIGQDLYIDCIELQNKINNTIIKNLRSTTNER